MKEQDQKMTIYDSLDEWNKPKVLKRQKTIDEKLDLMAINRFEIGRELFHIKKIVGHGNFKRYIRETWGERLPHSTASLYMNIYLTFPDKPDAAKNLPLGFLIKVVQKRFPHESKQMIADHSHILGASERKQIESNYEELKEGLMSDSEFDSMTRKIMKGAQAVYGTYRRKGQKLREKRTMIQDFKSKAKKVIGAHKEIEKLYLELDESGLDEIGIIQKMLIESAENLAVFLKQEEIAVGHSKAV